jgi:hypothetical protein
MGGKTFKNIPLKQFSLSTKGNERIMAAIWGMISRLGGALLRAAGNLVYTSK